MDDESASQGGIDAVIAQSNYGREMGFVLAAHERGRAVVRCVVSETHANTRGLCHGGVISGLMDMAAGIAVKTQLDDPERSVATVSLTVNYQRPARVGHALIAEGKVKSGRRIVSCEISVTDDRNEAIASGLATLHVG